ncbi:MAG: YgjV family protein [Clostridiales bacterium]|nr:YgjV family protein [Clostridiales bacterium]
MNDFALTHPQLNLIISQIISAVATVLLLCSVQFKKHRTIVMIQALAAVLFAIQYFMIGAYEGMICNLVGSVRNAVYSLRNKNKYVDSAFCPAVFSLIFLISGILTYKNPVSLLPTFAMIISSFVLWIPQTQKLRALTYPTSLMWLVYNIINRSYVAILTEILNEISLTVGLIRYRSKKKT